MADPVPHQSFMSPPLEGVSRGLLDREAGRGGGVDFPTFPVLNRRCRCRGWIGGAWVTHCPRRVSGGGVWRGTWGVEGNMGSGAFWGCSGGWEVLWGFRGAACWMGAPLCPAGAGGGCPGQVRAGCDQGSALPSAGTNAAVCPSPRHPHGCLELHEVPDVHLQRAGVCESSWARRGGGDQSPGG